MIRLRQDGLAQRWIKEVILTNPPASFHIADLHCIATRYDKRADIFLPRDLLAAVDLAAH